MTNSHASNRSGSALVLGTIVTLVLAMLATALIAETVARSKATHDAIDREEVTMIAESAIERTRRALFVYRRAETWDWSGANGVLDHCVEHVNKSWSQIKEEIDQSFTSERFADYQSKRFSDAPANEMIANDAPTNTNMNDDDFFLARPMPYAQGGFFVIVVDDNDGDDSPIDDANRTVRAIATATIPEGPTVQLEAVLDYHELPGGVRTLTLDHAVLTNGSIRIRGNPTITGAHGGIHSNEDIFISGSPSISGNVTAQGSIESTGSPNFGGDVTSNAPEVPIPPINPLALLGAQTYMFSREGRILDASGGLVADLSQGGRWNGWDFTRGTGPFTQGSDWDPAISEPPTWKLSGNNTAEPGLYYFEGRVKISGNPRSRDNPYQISIVSSHSIEVSGNVNVTPFYGDLTMLAGTDIKITGTPGAIYEGVYAAHEQIQISGNPTIMGGLVAEDFEDKDDTVKWDEFQGAIVSTSVNGNPTIINNRALETRIPFPPEPLGDAVTIRVIRRVK